MDSMGEKLVRQASDYARGSHEGQFRKASGLPYFTHVAQVVELLGEYTDDPEMISAAYLHDTMEDCDVSFDDLSELFGRRVACFVRELTNDEAELEKQGKVDYMIGKLSGMDADTLLIKMCDSLANMLDNPSERAVANYMEIWTKVREMAMLSEKETWFHPHEDIWGRLNEAYESHIG